MEYKELRILIGSATDGRMVIQSALQIGDSFWLVPKWLTTPDGRFRTPAVAIRLDELQPQLTPKSPHADALLTKPLSIGVAEGDAQSIANSGLEAVEGPSDRFPVIENELLH